MDKEAKLQYDSFLENDELHIFFPSMTGDWKKDKTNFLKIWAKNKEAINETEVNISKRADN